MTDYEARRQAPEPREVQWDTEVELFTADALSPTNQAIARLGEYDLLGVDRNMDMEGLGAEGFPTAKTRFTLPNGTTVNVRLYASTLQQIKDDTYGGDRSAPWGGDVHARISATGGFSLTEFPLRLGFDWEREPSQEPPVVGVVSANGKDVPFLPIVNEDEPDTGRLQPKDVDPNEFGIIFVPSNADFLSGMRITFPNPTQQTA